MNGIVAHEIEIRYNVVFDKERIITEYREKENWNDYRIEVHGLKSALGNIGAQVLSDVAKTLEHAAIEKDLKTIEDGTPLFLRNLHDLAVQLTLILGHKQPVAEVTGADEDNVKLQLERLERFIEEWESERALEVLAKLPASKLDRGALGQIEERLSALDYEGALEIVTRLVQSLYR